MILSTVLFRVIPIVTLLVYDFYLIRSGCPARRVAALNQRLLGKTYRLTYASTREQLDQIQCTFKATRLSTKGQMQ